MERDNDNWTVYPIINGCSTEPVFSGTKHECREYMMRATTLRPCAEFIMLKDE